MSTPEHADEYSDVKTEESERESDEDPLVPTGVLEGIEDARNGDFATKDSLEAALFSDD